MESSAVDVFFLSRSLFDEFDSSASIGELRKPCLTWWVCVCSGKGGSDRGKKGKTEGNTYTRN